MAEISLETVHALLLEHRRVNDRRFDDLEALVKGQNGKIDANRRSIEENRNDITALRVWVPLVGGVVTIGSIVATVIVQVLMK